jgi:hypothetical protein
MKVSIKKDQNAYFKASRKVFKALMAAAAQRMLEDGANRQLLNDTYDPEDAWALFLHLNPAVAKKLAALEPKAPPKPSALDLKLIQGGAMEAPNGEGMPEKCPECGSTVPMKQKDQANEDEAPHFMWECNDCGEAFEYQDEEALVKDDGSCACACHNEHGEWEATGHNCCIDETNGDEVL